MFKYFWSHQFKQKFGKDKWWFSGWMTYKHQATTLNKSLLFLKLGIILATKSDLRKATERGTLAANIFLALICYLSWYLLEANFILFYSTVPQLFFFSSLNSVKCFLAQDSYILFSVVRKYRSLASLHYNGKVIFFLSKWRSAFIDRKREKKKEKKKWIKV